MLIGNYSVINKSPGKFLAGSTLSGNRSNFNQTGQKMNRYFGGNDQMSSFPNGYLPPYSNMLPLKSGGLAIYNNIFGTGSVYSSNMAAGFYISGDLAGSGDIVTANANAIIYASAVISTLGSISANMAGSVEAVSTLVASGNIVGALGALSGAVSTIISSGIISDAAMTSKLEAAAILTSQGTMEASLIGVLQAIATLNSAGLIDADIMGLVDGIANLAGGGSMVASIQALANLVQTILSSGVISYSDMRALANISGTISPFTTLSPEALAAAVWNSIATEFNETGSMGEKVNDSGSAGDPWSTDLDGYVDGQAGKILKDKLSKGQFIALK